MNKYFIKINFRFYSLILLFLKISTLHSAFDKIEIINFEPLHYDSVKKYENYLVGELELNRDNLEKATQALEEAFKLDETQNPRNSLFRLLLKQKNFSEIIKQKDKLDDSLESNLILLKAYLSLNEKKEANELLNKLQAKFEDNEQITYFNVILKIELGQPLIALEILNKFLNNCEINSKHFIFYFLKSQVLIGLGKDKEAYKALEESLSLYPRFDQGWKFKAFLDEKLGNPKEAINSYKKLMEITTEVEKEIIQKLVSLLFSQKRYIEARTELLKLTDKNAEYFFDLALIEKILKNYSEAFSYVNKALEINSSFNQAKKLKIELLFLTKSKEVTQTIKKFVEEDPKNKLNLRLINSLKQVKDNKNIITFCNELSEKYFNNKNLLAALADLLVEKKLYSKATSLIEQILKINNNENNKLNLFLTLAQLNFKLKQYSKAIQYSEEVLKIDKNYPAGLNLLAYSYATENIKLKQALTLIERALVNDQNNPIFLDTKSFILYRMGNRIEACNLIMKAKMICPFNEIITKHEQEFKK